MIIATELAGLLCLVIALALLWIARPVDGKPAAIVRGRREVPYALVVVALLALGAAGVIYGFTA